MQELPITTQLPDFEIRVAIEEVEYLCRYRWNTRAGAWFLDLSDADGVLLVGGRRLSIGYSLFEQFKHLDVPPGLVMPIDTTERDIDPTLEDFGVRVLQYYVTAAEVDAFT
jgi:hypothetical protein